MRIRPLTSLLMASVLLTAASAQPAAIPAALLPDFNAFVLMRPVGDDLSPISVEQAADLLKDYDVVFIGEFHDHIANHLAEMALLRAIHARAPQLALSMEQFERDRQAVVDDYLAGKIGEESLTDGMGWRNYAEAYRPLVEYAKDQRLPIIASNAPQKIVRCVGREGAGFLRSLSGDRRALVAADLHLAEGAYKEKFVKFMTDDSAHDGSKDASSKGKREQVERSFAAQVTRDDTMAESIANFLASHPGAKVIHVTGSFHVEERLGTLERLRMRLPNLRTALVLPVGVKPGDGPVASKDAKGADFAILVRSIPEPYVTDAEKKAAETRQAARFRSSTTGGCKA